MANTTSSSILTFTSSWQQYVIGDPEPGSQVRIGYDSNRLPNERSTYNGSPTWSIIAFYRFAPDAPVQQVTLELESAGMVPGPEQTITNGSSFMFATIDVPQDAQSLEMWFLNSGRSGWQFWDSDYGQNYQFRFAGADISGVVANVVSSYPTPYSRFDLQLDSVALAVTSVTVNFRVTNIGDANFFAQGATMELSFVTEKRGLNVWSGNTLVPYQANIIFIMTYTAGGQTFFASNGGAGYLAIGQPDVVAAEGAGVTAVAGGTAPQLPIQV
jgi:hypothetical protein